MNAKLKMGNLYPFFEHQWVVTDKTRQFRKPDLEFQKEAKIRIVFTAMQELNVTNEVFLLQQDKACHRVPSICGA
jgi:hypothetical protein